MKGYYRKNKIELPLSGRRFVIGDIHGCYYTLRELIGRKLELTKGDHLYLLGDYINKGPDSKKTLDYIMQLIKYGYKVFPLRGNHEDQLLESVDNEPYIVRWLLRKSPDLLKEGELRKKYYKFLKTLRYYYELPDFFLVHAGFDFDAANPLIDKQSMLWRRMPERDTEFGGFKIILHGHQPLELDTIKDSVLNRNKIIGLDNGVNYTKKHKLYEYTKMGNLCALNLDTFELIVQKNIELVSEDYKSNSQIIV